MTRRKVMASRHPSGRINARKVEPAMTPASEVRRLRELAWAGVRPAEWGTELGRLYQTDKITAAQYAAGRKWAGLASDYTQACQGPRTPRTASLDPSGGCATDPDSDKGAKEARRHARIVVGYVEAAAALRLTGRLCGRLVVAVCEDDQVPGGEAEHAALRIGLNALIELWTAKRKSGKAKTQVIKTD
jgi:hypothetical protein